MYNYILQRSKRKTISISVNKDGEIIVKAPLFVSKKIIEDFICEKSDWIKNRVETCVENNEKKSRFWEEYTSFLLLGKVYKVKFADFSKIIFDGSTLFVPKNITTEKLKSGLVKIYKTKAKQVILWIADEFYRQTGLKGESIKINSAKKRWGSCSGKNSLNFSYFLIMADIRAVEYVVLHELCHTIYHNHSNKFWELVKRYMPDYKERQKILLKLQKKLDEQDW